VHDHKTYSGFAVATPYQGDEHRQITGSANQEQAAIRDHLQQKRKKISPRLAKT